MDLNNIAGLEHLLQSNQDVDDDDDENLDAELEAILSGKVVERPKRTARGKEPLRGPVKPRRPAVPHRNFSDVHDDDNDNDDLDEEGLENDLSLVAELQSLVGGSEPARPVRQAPLPPPRPAPVPPARTTSSVSHEKKLSSASVDSGQADLQRPKVDLGLSNVDSIQKPSVDSRVKPATAPVPKNSSSGEPKSEKGQIVSLRDQYKRAAFIANKSGDKATAIQMLKVSKQLDVMITAVEQNQPVDLSTLPPPPPPPNQSLQTEEINASGGGSAENSEDALPQVALEHKDAEKYFNAPPPPKTMQEALEQRANKFKQTLNEAKQEGNQNKARRLDRIVKKYEAAIKDHKAGKKVDLDALPVPPGFADLTTMESPSGPPQAAHSSSDDKVGLPQPKPSVTASTVTVSPRVKAEGPRPVASHAQVKSNNVPTDQSSKSATATVGNKSPRPLKRGASISDKQLTYLLDRQKMFKAAAVESKVKGDIQQAKEYLRMAKGFEPLIEATKNGLPIDATSIPTPPQLKEDFVVVTQDEVCEAEECFEGDEMYSKLEGELKNQIEMCQRNRENFLKLGDVSSASKFEKYASDSCKDLDMLRNMFKMSRPLPPFRYELRSFSIVICNTDVSSNEAVVEVLKAFDIPGKLDAYTYIRVEFPFPKDTPQTAKTKSSKTVTDPEFNESFKFEINRRSTQLARVFKRHPVKLELYAKGGLFRSDSLIGTASIKLTDLESKCTVYDSFPLMEGRKAIGGKIQAKVRIREPLLSKQVEEIREKWLVFP